MTTPGATSTEDAVDPVEVAVSAAVAPSAIGATDLECAAPIAGSIPGAMPAAESAVSGIEADDVPDGSAVEPVDEE